MFDRCRLIAVWQPDFLVFLTPVDALEDLAQAFMSRLKLVTLNIFLSERHISTIVEVGFT
jgi:hypothetical protein